MKKTLLLSSILLLCSIWVFAFDGSGSSADPYLVKTAEDLYMIRTSPNSCFKLTNDIDLKQFIADNYPDHGWAALCSTSAPFEGTFDGDGHTISNLYINKSTEYNGLFGYAVNATVKNLNIECDITGGNYTGGIIGYDTLSNISNCSVRGKIKGVGKCTGGLIGFGDRVHIDSCAVEADIYGYQNVGGLVGYFEKVEDVHEVLELHYYNIISKSYVKGNITSNGCYIGGLIGYDDTAYGFYKKGYIDNTSLVQDCYYDGAISVVEGKTSDLNGYYGKYVGGVTGRGTGRYIRCLVDGTIDGYGYVGGIVGWLEGSYWTVNGKIIDDCARIYSCVCLCTRLSAVSGNCGRLCFAGAASITGDYGTEYENKVNSACKVYKGAELQDVEDGKENGYAMGITSLQHKFAYTTIGWDFDNVWDIDEGNGTPYLKYSPINDSEGVTGDITFDFTNPSSLTPAVTPSEDEDAGVNITSTAFTNSDLTLSFGLGTRTQSFCSRLWTNDDKTYCLRAYQNGIITLSASTGCKLTKVTFIGTDVTALSADAGTVAEGVWTGDAQTVTFTIGTSCNMIDSILVDTIHTADYPDIDPSLPTCAAPVIMISNGIVDASCATAGAICHVKIIADEINVDGTHVQTIVPIPAYTVTCYATADGYNRSETVTQTLTIKAADVNRDGYVNISDVNAVIGVMCGKE